MPLPPPAVDYTNKDYASLRKAMFDLARYRLPEWTDQSPADLGTLLIDLFAYMGDVVLYYQDRIASESFLSTAAERRSVIDLLRLIGYELSPPSSSAAVLDLVFNLPGPGQPGAVTIPKGAQFATKPSGGLPAQTFEYLLPDLSIDVTTLPDQPNSGGKKLYRGLPVRQSQGVPTETLGSSTGEPSQAFALSRGPVLLDTLEVEVDEGAGFVRWDRRDNLLYYPGPDGRITLAGPESTDYYVRVDENDLASVVFGDGLYGRRPHPGANNIRARYRVGGGAAGNVAAGTIVDAKTTIPLLKSVTNPAPAVGGADRETIDHAVRFGPLAFRSGQRAVTLSDYISLAQQAGGVAKVRARSRGWNQIDLFVAPEGDTCSPAPPDLKKRLIAYFEDKRMVGTFLHIQDPSCVPVDVSLDVVSEYNYNPDAVRPAVEAAVKDLLAFKNVDFGKPLYLSKVYEAVEALPGVFAVTVRRFRRRDGQSRFNPIVTRASRLILTTDYDIAPQGYVDVGDFELPYLGDLAINMTEVAR